MATGNRSAGPKGAASQATAAAAAALPSLFAETVALFHRLRATAAQMHGQGELSAGRRGILFELARLGPQSVPQMARARPVSRQYVRGLVDGLRADGLVDLAANPAHRRARWELKGFTGED